MLRVLAIVTLGLLVVYHAIRLIATQCTGAQCDWFIPVSLLLPLLILLVGGLAFVPVATLLIALIGLVALTYTTVGRRSRLDWMRLDKTRPLI